MADGISITAIGDKQLEKVFNRLPGALQKKIGRKAMRKGARTLQREIKSRVPVSAQKKGGKHLRDTIRVRAAKRSRTTIGFRITTGTAEELGIVGKGAKLSKKALRRRGYYPAHLELGTSTRAAVPYMRNSMADKRQSILRQIGHDIGKGIEREAKRA